MVAYARFDTPLGPCGLAWSDAGITSVRLLDSGNPDEPAELPDVVRRARDGIVGLLSGRGDDLGDVVLDDSGVPEFDRRVYAAARAIPVGETATYGDIAAAIGEPAQARAVGQALGRNPFPLVVPCHRVVGADGRLTGFSAPGGVATKVRILELEGARAMALFDADALFGDAR